MKLLIKKLFAVLLVFCFALGALPGQTFSIAAQKERELLIGVLSDTHYFPESYVNNKSEEFLRDTHCDAKLKGESSALLKAALETIAQRKEDGTFTMKYLLIPGDLTFNGEKLAHQEVAAQLKDFRERTGIEVLIINGNHDINNRKAATYATPDNRKVDANENPEMLYTTPELFRSIYEDFGFNQADSLFCPEGKKGGMMSYSVGLQCGYRLIAIDCCSYTSDITRSGKDEHESVMQITPELFEWIINETRKAEDRGEKVIGMAHGSIVEHFDLQKIISKNSTVFENERIAGRLADEGMHFVFTGHLHSNDVAKTISANGETIFDIETGALISYPNTYREVRFSNGDMPDEIVCRLDNVDCDDRTQVDISGVSDKYGVIPKPFRENFAMPALHGGSIEDGIRSNAYLYFKNAHAFRVSNAIKKALPNGITGLLEEKGIDLGALALTSTPALREALKGYDLSPGAFAQFINAVISSIDNKYILNTDNTEDVINGVVERFADFEIVEGNPDTAFGKIALLAFEYNAAGNEDPEKNPEILESIAALRSQTGADRIIGELLDIILNQLLLEEILPSISLNELDLMLPEDTMTKLRRINGEDLSVGTVINTFLDSAVKKLNRYPLINVNSSSDLALAGIYTACLPILGSAGRLKVGNALADLVTSFTIDEKPEKLGDFNITLEYKSNVQIVPTTGNYRLPADIVASKGQNEGEVVIIWNTMPGVDNSDVIFETPSPAINFIAATEDYDKPVPALDFGFFAIKKNIQLLNHSVTISGLEKGKEYRIKVGDDSRGYLSEPMILKIDNRGRVSLKEADKRIDFFEWLVSVYNALISIFNSFKTISAFLL